jgi:ABC-type multidrug transport system fused ATPase/permease subunit
LREKRKKDEKEGRSMIEDEYKVRLIFDEEIEAAITASQAKEFVDKKSGGADTLVEQKGRNLSGGQKQRLTIARALIKKPDILILDDSASALDFATDAKLRMAIREMGKTQTCFIVSQRAASVQYADLILVLDDGKVAGMGTHDKLLSENSVYQEIYYSQFPKEAANE